MTILGVLLHIWAMGSVLFLGIGLGSIWEAEDGPVGLDRRSVWLTAFIWWAVGLWEISAAIWHKWGEPVVIWLKADF